MTRNRIFNLCGLVVVFIICVSFLFACIKIAASKENEQLYLQGKVIFIDAGHGGKDNGANVDGVLEDSINMKISGYLFEQLIETGAYVLMSRTGDYDLASMYDTNRKRKDLHNRVKYINNSNPDLFISIHLNTYPSENVEGAQVFHQSNVNSITFSKLLQQEMNKLTSKERKVKLGDYYILNNTNSAGAIVECGFLSNTKEREKLADDSYQRKIAKAIKKGIEKYFISKE